MGRPLQVCLAISDERLNEAVASALRDVGHNPWPTYNASSTLSRLGQVVFDVLMTDVSCSKIDSTSFLPFVRQVYPQMRILALQFDADPEWPLEERACVEVVVRSAQEAVLALRDR